MAEIRMAHSTSCRKGYRTFTVRAYVNDDGIKYAYKVASDETLKEAADRALAEMRRDFVTNGYTPPKTVTDCGRMSAIMLDAWRF